MEHEFPRRDGHGDSCGDSYSHADRYPWILNSRGDAAGPPGARGCPGCGASPGTFEPSIGLAADSYRDSNEYPHGESHGDPMRTMDFPIWTLAWRFLRRCLFPRGPQWKFDSRGDAHGARGGAAQGTGPPRARGQPWHLRARAKVLLTCSGFPRAFMWRF